MNVPIITIDGPVASGKGTVARAVAEALGFHLLDSGAIYRAHALACLNRDIKSNEIKSLTAIAQALSLKFSGDRIALDGHDVTTAVRTEAVGMMASTLSAIPEVRAALFDRQRAFAQPPGLVADGRDMGTVIFPDAGTKVFLTASAEERARRRYKQLKEKGLAVTLAALLREIEARDARDAARPVAPLKPATDAVLIDSTGMPVDAVVAKVLSLVHSA